VTKAKVWLRLHITKDHTPYKDTEGLTMIIYGIK